ncbi:hypothetical protein [Streptomyces sp. MMG1121]|uniref:hypothetical protein n=1 Tax=Streptomyces sp. MMG1121 TaxID=1415544 RepID=UPI00131AFEB1|nr:hypothetical protein [Streptomyces sp. MMG1121]
MDEVPGLAAPLCDIRDAGCVAPDPDSEVMDPRTGDVLTVAAAYWSHGPTSASSAAPAPCAGTSHTHAPGTRRDDHETLDRTITHDDGYSPTPGGVVTVAPTAG